MSCHSLNRGSRSQKRQLITANTCTVKLRAPMYHESSFLSASDCKKYETSGYMPWVHLLSIGGERMVVRTFRYAGYSSRAERFCSIPMQKRSERATTSGVVALGCFFNVEWLMEQSSCNRLSPSRFLRPSERPVQHRNQRQHIYMCADSTKLFTYIPPFQRAVDQFASRSTMYIIALVVLIVNNVIAYYSTNRGDI